MDDSTFVQITDLDTPMEKMTELYPEQLDEIVGEYVSHFLYSFRPDLISGSNYMQFLEQWKHGSDWFAVFALRRTVMDSMPELTRSAGSMALSMYRISLVTKKTKEKWPELKKTAKKHETSQPCLLKK